MSRSELGLVFDLRINLYKFVYIWYCMSLYLYKYLVLCSLFTM